MKKKLFSILLSLAMVITMMPAMTMMAFASTTNIASSGPGLGAASVDTTLYWGYDDSSKTLYFSASADAITDKSVSSNAFNSNVKLNKAPWNDYIFNIEHVEILNDIAPGYTAFWFYEMENMTEIAGIHHLKTDNVQNMMDMFGDCYALTSLDVSGFNTSKVTCMEEMFWNCYELTSLDVSKFDTSEVTDMRSMFEGCKALTSLDVSGFDTSNVEDMWAMFKDCNALTSLDVSKFDTSKVVLMKQMFENCKALTSLDVSNFDTSSAEAMEHMFSCCQAITSLDVSNFDTSSVQGMSNMFESCKALTSLDVSNFDTSSVQTMDLMFDGCRALTSLDLSSFNTSKVTKMDYMFRNCISLKTLDLSNFDCTKVTSARDMFKIKNIPKDPPMPAYFSIAQLKTPKNFAIDVILPAVAEPMKWLYADTLDEYGNTSLPTNSAESITLVAGIPVSGWSELQQAIYNTSGDATIPATKTTNIIFKNDITASNGDSAITIPEGKKIVLDLNGHTIDRNLNEATANGLVINVEGNLTIKDIATGGGKITGGNNKCVNSKPYGGGVRVASGGALTMTGGEITGNFSVKADGDDGGGGVYVNKNGSFNMSGGKITDNMAETKGGGVYIVDNATFNMTGGEISGNSSTKGAGGVHSQGNCIMSGNSIISHNSGTGVNAYKGTFTMSGNSIISYNNATGTGAGGLLVGQDCEFTMSENSKISYNSSVSGPGGVTNQGTFKMIGGSIDHNTANTFGGIYANKNIILGGTAKIKDNVKGGEIIGGELSGGAPNNVYLPNNKYIAIADGTDAPASGMKVGVTTQTTPEEGSPVQLTTNGTANDTQYFFSDNADYYVGVNSSSNYLELKKPGAGNHIITVTPSEHGSVTPSPSDASAGATVTLTVTPASGYELSAGSLRVISGDGTEITVTKSGNTYTFTMPNSAVTVSALFIQAETPPGPTPGPDPEPTPAEEKYSVPVEGDSSVKVEATIENEKAKVSEITKKDLEEFVENTESKTNVDSLELDFTEAKQDVMGVEFTKPTLENVQDVLESKDNKITNLVVKMSEGTVSLDAKALEAVTEQAEGDTIILVVDKTQDKQLSTAKQETLKDYNVNKTFEAYFESNGHRIHDFKGGVATVSMKFEPTQGSNTKNYKIYYLDDNAKMHKYATKYEKGMLVFATTHFSDYAIVYDGKVDVLLAQAKSSNGKIKLSWNGLDNITKYVVYGAKCGHNYKKLKTTTGKSYTVKKASGKKLKAHKTYKFYVVAYDAVGNKVQSRSIHYVYKNTQGKYANVKSIKAKYDELLLSVGVTQKISAKYKMYSGKKHLKKTHGQALKFFTNNTDVVTVSSGGTVKAVGKGTATIYIQDIGGKYCKTKVTVE